MPRVRAERLNELLAETSAYPRLTDHAGDGWHIHYRDSGLRLGAVLRALISVGTALHLSGRGMDRLHCCALAECRRPFGDFSRWRPPTVLLPRLRQPRCRPPPPLEDPDRLTYS
jgi:hypothetical protein